MKPPRKVSIAIHRSPPLVFHWQQTANVLNGSDRGAASTRLSKQTKIDQVMFISIANSATTSATIHHNPDIVSFAWEGDMQCLYNTIAEPELAADFAVEGAGEIRQILFHFYSQLCAFIIRIELYLGAWDKHISFTVQYCFRFSAHNLMQY